MEEQLPRAYLEDVNIYVSTLGSGYNSKDDYFRLDSAISELTDLQAIQFLELVKDGISDKMDKHRKVCKNPNHCGTLMEGEKAINSMEKRIDERKRYLPIINYPKPETPNHPPDHTTARQVLALKFLLQYAKINVTNDKAAERFLHFLTGKSPDNLYKLWRNPYNKDVFTAEVDDLRFVRKFFEDLGATEIVKVINNEIDKP